MVDSGWPRVVVDMRASYGSNRRRGIGRYAQGFASALARTGGDATFVIPRGADAHVLNELSADARVADRAVFLDLARGGEFVFHSGSLFEFPTSAPVIPRIVTELGMPVSATLYDAIPYAEPDRYQSTALLRRFHQLRAMALRSADHLLAISHHAARSSIELLDLDPNRVTVVGTGVDDRFSRGSNRAADATAASHGLRGLSPNYVVCVAGSDPRKNGAGLIRGFARLSFELRERYQLVIVGQLDDVLLQDWRTLASSCGCSAEQVLFAGEVEDDLLVNLYRGARLSVFASLNEGFGLPVAEAAACGCPTITSDRTSVPEVLDWPDSAFAADDPASIAACLASGLTNDRFRADLERVAARAAAKWRWERVIECAVDAWSSPSTRRFPTPPSEGTTRPRIAMVGPFAGSPSGIGTYNERLLPHLDAIADLTCFVEKFQGEAPLGTDGRRFPSGALGRHIDAAEFDHVVYTIGNSPFHLTSVLDLVSDVPGHVWLHEAQLVELHVGAAHLLKNQPWGERQLRRLITSDVNSNRDPGFADRAWDDLLDIGAYHERGIRMLGPTVAAAKSVIVNSQIAADLVQPYLATPNQPVLVLPNAFPWPAEQSGPPPSGPAEIAVLGWLSVAKGVDRIVTLLGHLRAEVDVRLVFVGRALDGSGEVLLEAAAAHGVADSIEICGYLPDHELVDRLARCRAGLRLAGRTDGEMSAAVADLVALGVPVVTNLTTMQPSSAGLVVLPNATDDQLIAALRSLLVDDAAYRAARLDAIRRAQSWGFADVARRLVDWLGATGA